MAKIKENRKKLKRKIQDIKNKDVVEKKRKTTKTTKVITAKKKKSGRKEDTSFHLQNNVFIKQLNENKNQYEKIKDVEKLFSQIKTTILSLNIEQVDANHYEDFSFREKNKMDFILPELDNVVNSSNIDLLKQLSHLSFYPIYNETLSKKLLDWLVKVQNIGKRKGKREEKKKTDSPNTSENKSGGHFGGPEVRDFSYYYSLYIILTYFIYKNDIYSDYCSLIYLNIMQWAHSKRMGLGFRLYTLKAVMKRFNNCTNTFIDKKLLKSKKKDIDIQIDENEFHVLKNVFLSLYNSIDCVDVNSFMNINDKNCVFEMTKFFLDLIKKPLIHSLHVLCINYLIKLIKKCYEYKFAYDVNIELYDLGPKVNLFTRVVNFVFSKILSVLKEIKNEEHVYTMEHINSINHLMVTFFKNILNSCIRIIIPQVQYNDGLKTYYLISNDKKYLRHKKEKLEMSFEENVVFNACDPIFSFIEISLINHCEKYEKNIFIDFIKVLIRECKKVEQKYNILDIIKDEFIDFIKKEDKQDIKSKVNDEEYLKLNKIDPRRQDSTLSYSLSDAYTSSIGSETEESDEEPNEEEEKDNTQKEREEKEKKEEQSQKSAKEKEGKEKHKGTSPNKTNAEISGSDVGSEESNEEKEEEEEEEESVDEENQKESVEKKRKKKKIKHADFSDKIESKRKCSLIFNNKEYILSYESVMVRYLNFLIKYINCEKYQIRNIILDLFLNLLMKKKTNKNESLLNNLFKLFLERVEDPNMIVRGKALSILITLTNLEKHDNSLIYNFIFNRSREKINMYKIISSNVYNHKSSIRKLIIQYMEIVFETLVYNDLNYTFFLRFISEYIYNLSLDSISSVRRQLLITVNSIFTLVNDNAFIARLWVIIIFAAITDVEETVKEEAMNIFLNTFIRHFSECSIFNKTEKEIKEVLKKKKFAYFKVETESLLEEENEEEVEKVEVEKVEETGERKKKRTKLNSSNEKSNNEKSSNENEKNKETEENEEVHIKGKVLDKNNNGILHLIHIYENHFDEEIDNYFVDILKMITKYDLLYFNLYVYCLKSKKNNYMEEFINNLNSFLFNLRYFSIRCWNMYIFDFLIELSKSYKHLINIDNILFLLNRCYKIYLLSFLLEEEEREKKKESEKKKEKLKEKSKEMDLAAENTNQKEQPKHETVVKEEKPIGNNFTFMTELVSDYILSKEHLIEENKNCANNVLKNIMLKLFIIFNNLLDTTTTVKEEFLDRMEYTIFNFNCPICFIYIILNILIKKKKVVHTFIDKLKKKIIYFMENVEEAATYNVIFCNLLITFVFLLKHFSGSEKFLYVVSDKLKKVFDTANKDNCLNSATSAMLKNCIYITQSVLLIEKNINIKSDLFYNFERDLKNENISMNIVNNLIILIYYMIINFGSTCNKFIYILLRFFRHENSYIRYLSFYILAKLISEDYIKFSNQFFFAFLYLLADKNEVIRKQSLSVFKHVLLLYNKQHLITYIIELIFVLNNCYSFKLSKHLSSHGNSFQVKTKEDRYDIYCYVIENLTNSEKFSLQQKLITEYLVQYVYNYDNYFFADDKTDGSTNPPSIIPTNVEAGEGAVLFDILNILNSKLMKIKLKKDFTKLAEEKNKHLKSTPVETSAKVLHDMMKSILKRNSLPVLLSLRAIMLKTKSYFFQYLNNLIIYLCYDYKDSLDDLISDETVQSEILHEMQNFVYVDLLQVHKEQSFLFDKHVNVNFFALSEERYLEKEKGENEENEEKEAIEEKEEKEKIESNDEQEKEKKKEMKNKKINNTTVVLSDNGSSSDYDEASDLLHGIDDIHDKKNKKKKKKQKQKQKEKGKGKGKNIKTTAKLQKK